MVAIIIFFRVPSGVVKTGNIELEEQILKESKYKELISKSLIFIH